MVHIKKYTIRTIRAPLTLTLAGKTLTRETIDIEANGRRVLIYPVGEALSGALEARLEIDDDFPTDNRAYLAVTEASVVRIRYIGPGNPFLSILFSFFRGLEFTSATRW